jgi:antitoxin MazE
MNTIRTRIVRIGNSQGIRIPKLLLDQTDFGDEVELELQENSIVIRSSKSSRQGWEEQFKIMAEQGDDRLLDEAVQLSSWDEADWEW